MRPSATLAGMSSRTFALSLLEAERVAVVAGCDFGPGGEGYVRASLAAAPEAIAEGLGRLGRHHRTLAAGSSRSLRATVG